MDQIFFKTSKDWRSWLKNNHAERTGVWLVYYKKHTGQPTVTYEEAVEEAICFGWIDSLVKRIDEDTYMQKFTPRKAKSVWSDINKKRVQKMTTEGKMTSAGIRSVQIAKENGKWDEPYASQQELELSDKLMRELEANQKAFNLYHQLSPSHKKNFTNWIMSAKREETQEKRCREMIKLLEKNQKLGMK